MATSYGNNGGTGERRPEIVVTTNIVSAGTDIGAQAVYTADHLLVFVDGNTATGLGNGQPAREFGTNNNGADINLRFDFGVGASIVIDEFKLYISGTTAFGTWTWEGSNDAVSWTVIGASFALTPAGGSLTITRANSTGYRYYRIHTTSGAGCGAGSGAWSEIEFKLFDASVPASLPLFLRAGEAIASDIKLVPEITDGYAARCSVYNTGGKGNRTTTITATTDLTLGTGVIANVVDGDYSNNASHAIAPSAGQTQPKTIQFDFGVGKAPIIDTILFWTAAGPGNNDGSWKFQASPDASSWVDLDGAGSNLFDTVSPNAYLLTKRTVVNTTGYRYYRILMTSGSTSTLPVITEVEFRISGITAAGGGGGGAAKTIVVVCT